MQPLYNVEYFDDQAFTHLNNHELNLRLPKMNNVDFYLTLHALIKYNTQKPWLLLQKLSDENISRIMYDTMHGIMIVEDLFYMLILPTFMHCIKNNKQYLISPEFRLLNYFKGSEGDTLEAIKYIADDIVTDIMIDAKMNFYEVYDGNVPSYIEDRPFEEDFWTNICMNLSSYFHPFMGAYLQDSRTNIGDKFIRFKRFAAIKLYEDYRMAMYELGILEISTEILQNEKSTEQVMAEIESYVYA